MAAYNLQLYPTSGALAFAFTLSNSLVRADSIGNFITFKWGDTLSFTVYNQKTPSFEGIEGGEVRFSAQPGASLPSPVIVTPPVPGKGTGMISDFMLVNPSYLGLIRNAFEITLPAWGLDLAYSIPEQQGRFFLGSSLTIGSEDGRSGGSGYFYITVDIQLKDPWYNVSTPFHIPFRVL